MEIPQGVSWTDYTTIEGETSLLQEGDHVMRLMITGPYANIDRIHFAKSRSELTSLPSILASSVEQVLYVYDIRGFYCGTIRVEGGTPSFIERSLKRTGYLPGVYLLRACDGSVFKHILK